MARHQQSRHALFNRGDLPNCNLRGSLYSSLSGRALAAPTFFPPEKIAFGGEDFLFVDGGITPYNNPALIAFPDRHPPVFQPRLGNGRGPSAPGLGRHWQRPACEMAKEKAESMST